MTRHVLVGSGRIRALLALGVVLGLGAVTTGAYWTDDATVTGVTLSTGRLDLKIDGQDNVTGYTSLNLTDMVPGNSVAAVLTISNSGTVPFSYTATSTASDTKSLATVLQVKVTTDPSVSGSAPAKTCASSGIPGSGTTLNGGLINAGRTVAAGASEKLCVQVTLPAGAANSFQGATAGITLAFTAAQVVP